MADDVYEGLCPHGTLPLVRDPGGPGGLRFAVPGVDAPDACVPDASGLPDAEITLRTFRTRDEAAPYLAALAEHGGNAFSWLVSPVAHKAVPYALVVRADRSRLPGATLDEAVALRGDVAGLAGGWAAYRTDRVADADRQAGRSALASRWAAQERAVRAIPGTMLGDMREDGVAFHAKGSQSLFVLGDRVLRWEARAAALPPDLARAHARRLSEAGASEEAAGRWSLPVRGRPAGEVLADATELSAGREALAAVAASRGRLATLRTERACMAVVARGVAGFPVLLARGGMQAAQGDTEGRAHSVPGHVLSRLTALDMLRAAWTPASADPRPAMLVPTDAAAALLRGDVAGAAEMARDALEPAAPGAGDLAGEIAAVAEALHPGARDALAGCAHIPPEEGEDFAAPRTAEAWTAVVAALCAGLAAVDADGRLVPVPAGVAPRP